jgi:murein DD-endopeptidase MepM/ murein hydrolase activator NlpD
MSGMSTALVNGVAGGLSQGVTTGDWKDSMVDSMRNSAASYLGGNLGGGNDALTNASSMLFRKMLGSKEDFSWDTVAKNDAIGKLVGDYLSGELAKELDVEADKNKQEQEDTAQGLKLMNMFENTIGGFFSRLGKDMNALASDVGNAAAGVKSAWGSIKSGEAWENIKAGAATAWEGVKGAASWVKDKAVSAWNGVKNVAASAWNSVAGAVSTAVGAVKDFGQSVKNKVVWGVYGTNDDLEVQKAIVYQTPVRSDMPPGVRGNLEDIEGLLANNGGKPIGTGFIKRATVESRFKKGTNMSNYTRKLSAYYSSEDNPISQEKAMQRLCEANGGITPAELQGKVNRGEPINEPADMSWNKDVQKMYVSKPVTATQGKTSEIGEWGKFLKNYPKKMLGIITGAISPDLGFPLPEELKDNVTSPYGMRIHPKSGKEKFHNGVDYGAEIGTPIYAAADGIVSDMKYSDTYGNLLVLDHKDGLQSFYAHTSKYNVTQGQKVKRGEHIASTGNSGKNTTGAHLHFEIRRNGQSIKPKFKFK